MALPAVTGPPKDPKKPRAPPSQGLLHIQASRCTPKKRAPAEASALRSPAHDGPYIFGLHFLAASSHTPPSLSQLALSVAFVTSPAKAGPVTARASAMATIEIIAFMNVLLTKLCQPPACLESPVI